jgi:CP family cyanate transporter-like MFS transporter
MLVGACLLGFAIFSPIFCVPPMQHVLRQELTLTYAETSWLFTVAILMLVCTAIPGGYIADRIGFKRAAGIGAILIAVGAFLRSMTSDYSSLIGFTVVMGVGIGLSFPNLPKLISSSMPAGKSGATTGLYYLGILLGVALPLAFTMPVVFPLTNSFQGVFLFWSIPTIAIAVWWWVMVKEPARLLVSTNPSPSVTFSQILRNRNLWILSSILLLHNFFFYSWTGWAPAFMMSKGAAPTTAGLISSITIWASLPAVLLMPRLFTRVGRRRPFIWVASLVLAVCALLAGRTPLNLTWLVMAVVGLSNTYRYLTILILPVEMMSNEEVGRASGVLLSIGYLGAIIGPFIGGLLLDMTGSFDQSLLLIGGVSFATAALVFRLRETGPKAGRVRD